MFIYNLLIRAYGLVIHLSSLRNKKAKQWVAGRKHWREKLTNKIKQLKQGDVIWIHCASYGEFEQGRPLIEAIKNEHPSYQLLLSFFSPSGYEAFKDWPGADVVTYLPLDTKSNALDFINCVQPKVVIFIKYEFWLNFLMTLKSQSIPTYLVSAVFKNHHPFFKWYGRIFKNSLTTFTRLFVQDEHSGQLLTQIGVNNFEVCGDTRFDRVLAIKNDFKGLPYFETFCGQSKIIVAGSTWPDDEAFVIEAFQKLKESDLKLIIAPHQVDEKNIKYLTNLLEKNNLPFLKYSDLKHSPATQILILDTIGLLSKIYHYATLAYIGGGFDGGIHNCLEPAVYLKPVIFFGNDFHKYNEAVDLVELKAARNVLDLKELETALDYFLNISERRERLEKELAVYLENNSGSTKKVLKAMRLN
jgi:3-deoxy-D-manno-octulosonic-acid transferase